MKKTDSSASGEAPSNRGINAFYDHLKRSRELQFQALVDETQRVSAAARTRGRAMNQLMERTGVQASKLDALHDKDWQTLLKQARRQEKRAIAHCKQQRAYQRQVLRTIVQHRDRFEYQAGNPHTSICLWRAVRAPSVTINPQTFNDGIVQIVSPPTAAPVRVGENIIRLSVRVTANPAHGFHLSPAAAVDIFTSHDFETKIPHDGVLSVIASYAPMGNIFLGAPGDCIVAAGALAEVTLFMFVQIETVDGSLIDLPPGNMLTIVSEDVQATCDGASRSILVGSSNGVAFQLAHNNLIAVRAGDTVRASVGIEIFLSTALRGTAQATFAPQPFGLNVPMVLVKIDS